MERRVLIAVLLSFLVLYVYQVLVPTPPEQKPAQASKTATVPNASAPAASNPAPSVQGTPAATGATPPAATGATAPAAAGTTPPGAVASPEQAGVETVPSRDIAVDNAAVHAVFSTRGGVLKSWQLKKYHDEEGRPLEIIAGHAPADAPLPFTIATDDPAVSARLAVATFTVSNEAGGSGQPWHAEFDYS